MTRRLLGSLALASELLSALRTRMDSCGAAARAAMLSSTVAGTLQAAGTVVAVMVGMAAGRPRRPLTIHLDFGIVEFDLIGPHAEEVYLVRFTCGCVGIISHGRMIRRTGGIALVCAHVAAT